MSASGVARARRGPVRRCRLQVRRIDICGRGLALQAWVRLKQVHWLPSSIGAARCDSSGRCGQMRRGELGEAGDLCLRFDTLDRHVILIHVQMAPDEL